MKSKGHIYMANLLMKEIKEKGAVTIKGTAYTIPQEVRTAILQHPEAFRAGAVGPDFYPDIIIGQSDIHPSYSGEWLKIVENELSKTSKNSSEWTADYAFYLGYMMHYANDMWTHYYVNDLSKGSFPGLEDIRNNPDSALIAIRHILIETYIDKKVPATESMNIQAPVEFIGRCFSSADARAKYTELNVLGYLLSVQDDVNTMASDSTKRMLDIVNYYPGWQKEIKTAITEWYKLWNKIAVDFLQDDGGMSQAKEDFERWVKDYAVEATAIPVWAIDLARSLKLLKVAFELILEPLKKMATEVLSQMLYAATGISVKDFEEIIELFKKMMKQPELYLNNGILFDSKNVTDRIDADCGNFGKTGSAIYNQTFRPFAQALNMGMLSLIGVDNLNSIMVKYGSPIQFIGKLLQPSVSKLNITIKTSSKLWSGTDDNVYFGLALNDGKDTVLKYLMDKPGYNDFEMGDKDTYVFQLPYSVLYSDIKEIRLWKDYIKIDDDWRISSIVVTDAVDGFVLLSNSSTKTLTKRNVYPYPVTKKRGLERLATDSKVLNYLYSLDVAIPKNEPKDYKSWEQKECFLNDFETYQNGGRIWNEFTKVVFQLK
ncbi:PLAT/LH2 domain-containing protein [[Clostridium] polysaccharolyticum]|uniref:Zinc dependent phospholipase C n=1 Tax=[Clostridium] polysaccharolyticum TaxID=29364 RepID=A0A1I0FFE9_9FIRM|nr:PLAT/LH2 domain-containing protein [[Clostridium] polysaccharolyticum]SET56821.1 Zinc dependent phospholipase C [[Clostridium] polysaccharolyticum]